MDTNWDDRNSNPLEDIRSIMKKEKEYVYKRQECQECKEESVFLYPSFGRRINSIKMICYNCFMEGVNR
jgi:hypothetical protein